MPLDGFPRFFLFFLFQSFKNLFLLCCSKIYLKWNGSEERSSQWQPLKTQMFDVEKLGFSSVCFSFKFCIYVAKKAKEKIVVFQYIRILELQ